MDIKIIKEVNYPDSIFCYIPNILSNDELEHLSNYLDNINDFKYNPSCDGNNTVRLQKWYNIDNKYFCPLWKERFEWWQPCEYDVNILKIQNTIQKKINTYITTYISKHIKNIPTLLPNINSCLINKYRNGKDHISPHRDTHLSFGLEPTIVGISIGETRTLDIKRVKNNDNTKRLSKQDKEYENLTLELENNSMFIMAGSSQRFYSHSIPECDTDKCRYSLTFREFIL